MDLLGVQTGDRHVGTLRSSGVALAGVEQRVASDVMTDELTHLHEQAVRVRRQSDARA